MSHKCSNDFTKYRRATQRQWQRQHGESTRERMHARSYALVFLANFLRTPAPASRFESAAFVTIYVSHTTRHTPHVKHYMLHVICHKLHDAHVLLRLFFLSSLHPL